VRLNSWDVLVEPGRVLESILRVPHPLTVVLLAAMFVIVGAGCVRHRDDRRPGIQRASAPEVATKR